MYTSGRTYRLLNVFAEDRLAGNALCVFEDGSGLSDATMQAVALQFNLSETTFLFPSARADAAVRIFTPTAELPFAGHPTLGSACVVRDLRHTGERLTLEMKAGVIPVTAHGDLFTLQAAKPSHRPVDAAPDDLAALLGLAARDLGEAPMWVSTGTEQLLVPLRSADAVRRVRIDAQRAEGFKTSQGAVMIYVWAEDVPGRAIARFFFSRSPGTLGEDPGTGSACANLGGWMLATGRTLPVALTIHQGDHLGRACRLHLSVDEERRIFVGGRVIEIGRGQMEL